MKYSDPVQRKAEEDAARTTLEFLQDFIPGWGDVRGIRQAYDDPSAINIIAAGAGALGPIGDGVSKILNYGDNAVDLVRSLWTATKNSTPSENAFSAFQGSW